MRKFLLVGALFLFTQWTNAQNLLTNPGAESNYDGWLNMPGGSGWGVSGENPLEGSYCWSSSYNNCSLAYDVNLLERGYTAEQLDAAPAITGGVYVRTNGISGGYISVKVELFDAEYELIHSKTILENSLLPKNTDWTKEATTVSGYKAGVRIVRLIFTGRSLINWAGQYGPSFDNAFLMFTSGEVNANLINNKDLSPFGVSLRGNISNPNGKSVSANFEYGTTSALGTTVAASQSPVSEAGFNVVSASLTNLEPSTTYYYKLSANDGTTTTSSDIQTFTTLTPVMSISKKSAFFEKDASSASFDINSNVAWTVSCDQDWLSFTTTSGTNNGQVTINSTANTGDRRRATVVISGSGNLKQTFVVTQRAAAEQSTAAFDNDDTYTYIPIIDRDSVVIVTPSDRWSWKDFRFKPTQSGKYSFKSYSKPYKYPSIELYLETTDNDPIASNNVNGFNNEFYLEHDLTAYQVYVIRIKESSNESSTMSLKIGGGGILPFEYTGWQENWSNVGNWSWQELPSVYNNVIISGNVAADVDIDVQKITIRPTGSLTVNDRNLKYTDLILEADADYTGSFITNASNLLATSQIYLNKDIWSLYTPTVSGLGLSYLFQDVNNKIATKGSVYGMADYNETLNKWNSFIPTTSDEKLTAGKGYCLRSSEDGIISSFGNVTSGDYSVNVTKNGEGWNCIGNPYLSSIRINRFGPNPYDNFIYKNDIFEESYAGVYLWDNTSSSYKVINNSETGGDLMFSNVQAGQAFFIKAKAAGTVTFQHCMQEHQNAIPFLKSTKAAWPSLQLLVKTADKSASTTIAFNDQMTNGLDVSYDAGILRGTLGLNVYSRLVDDNGVDFTTQCLPTNYTSLVIPIGVETNEAGTFNFSLKATNISENQEFILEDRKANVFTSINNGAVYTATLDAGTQGVGRFFLHVKNGNITTNDVLIDANNISVYNINNTIYINGEVQKGSVAQLFNVNGKLVGTYTLQDGNNKITASLANGVYVVTIKSNNQVVSKKVSVLNQ